MGIVGPSYTDYWTECEQIHHEQFGEGSALLFENKILLIREATTVEEGQFPVRMLPTQHRDDRFFLFLS